MLDERLREHIDDIAPPLTLDDIRERMHRDDFTHGAAPDELTTIAWDDEDLVIEDLSDAPSQQKRSRALVLAVAAVIGLVVAGMTISNLSNDELPVATDNGEAAEGDFPTLPGDLSIAQWREISMPFDSLRSGAGLTVNDITTASNGVAWAAGAEFPPADEGDPASGGGSQPAIWRSNGGEEWEAVDLELGPVQDLEDEILNGSGFTHVVTTEDGAVWAFGSRIDAILGPDGVPEAGTGSFAPIGYRTVDGETWDALQVPSVVEARTGVASVSANGNSVAVTVQSDDIFLDGNIVERSATVVTTDGSSWSPLGETTPPENHQNVLLDDEEFLTVFDSELPGEAPRAYQVIAGPDLFIATGVEDDLLSNAVDDAAAAAAQRVWFSEDAQRWRVLDVELGIGSLGPGALPLFPHDSGVLTIVGPDTSGDSRSFLANIDSAGAVEELGEPPTPFAVDIFTVDSRLFLLDRPAGPDGNEAVAGPSIWVAEFPSADDAPSD